MKLRKFLAGAGAAVLSALTLTAMLSMPAAAKRPYEQCIESCRIYDRNDLMTDAAEREVNERLQAVSKKIDMYVAVVLYSENSGFIGDAAVEAEADNIYDKLFCPEGTATDGALLIVDYSTRYAYISTCGMGQLYFYNGSADDRVSRIINDLKYPLKQYDYRGIAETFCQDLESYHSRGIPKNAYTYNARAGLYYYEKKGQLVESTKLPMTFGMNWVKSSLIALLVGGIGWLITFFSIKGKYNAKLPLSPTNYISQNQTEFTVQEDMFLHTKTTSCTIDRGGSGGGGGGGGSSHFSGGGISHGGGGGHF